MVLPLSQSLATLPTWRPTSIFGPGTSTTTTWQSWMRTRARIAHRILRMRAQSELGAEHEPLARPCSLPRRHVERTLRRSAESDCCSVGHAGRAEWRRPKSRGMPMNEMNLTCALVHMHPCAHVHVHVQSLHVSWGDHVDSAATIYIHTAQQQQASTCAARWRSAFV